MNDLFLNANDCINNRYNLDPGFGSILIIEGFGRAELAKLFAGLGYRVGAEIGVEEGKNSQVLCEANPDLKLFCVDPWVPYFRHGKRKNDRFYREARTRLLNYNCEIVRKTSMEAVKGFEDGGLDFVYIDADHSWKGIVNDLVEWEKKVRVGGIVSGHDYWKPDSSSIYPVHVKDVVDAYRLAYGINPLYLLKGVDREPSWFWVKDGRK